MKIKSLVFSVIIIITCVTFVLFKIISQNQLPSQTINSESQKVKVSPLVQQEIISDEKLGENLPEKREKKPKIVNPPDLSNRVDRNTKHEFINDTEIINSMSSEFSTPEEIDIEPEFDDTEIPLLTEEIEGELTDILVYSYVSYEEIDKIFNVIRTGTVEDSEALDPSDDYSNRLSAVLRLIKQSDMNSTQIISVINDIFPQ